MKLLTNMNTKEYIIQNSNYIRFLSKWNTKQSYGICDACGGFGPYEFREIIDNKLAGQWGLSSTQKTSMSCRESMFCAFCECSYRLRLLARAIKIHIGVDSNTSLLQAIRETSKFNKIKIAEINSCGVLHEIIKEIPNLTYTEYGSKNPAIPDEDLQSLSFEKGTFDLILTSDTLEHIPNPKLALEETFRVLKPGGAHIMTVPVILDRKTKLRAYIDEHGEVLHKLSKSYHGAGQADYLVWNEFGFDFIKMLQEIGFDAEYFFVNAENTDDHTGIIIARKSKQSDKNNDKTKKIEVFADAEEETNIKLNDKIYEKYKFAYVKVNDKISDHKWQAERVAWLKNKLKLTENHTNNLEDILNSQKDYTIELKKRYNTKSQELQKIKNSKIWKVQNKIFRVGKSTKKLF